MEKTLDKGCVCVYVCVCMCVCVCVCVGRGRSQDGDHSSAAAAAARVYTDTFNEKTLDTPHVFAYIYKLLYTYVYPYNHTNMFLGCPGRGPGPWEPLGGPKHLRIRRRGKVARGALLAIY